VENDANQPMDLNDRDRLLGRAQTFRWIGAAMMVGGAGALAIGAVKLAMHRGKPKALSTEAQFSFGSDSFVLGIQRAF
jgi:hypothetical protein